jgi:EthD domain
MRETLAVVLAARSGSAPTALEESVAAEADRLRREGVDATVAIAVAPDAFAGTAHGAEVPDRIAALLLSGPPPGGELAQVVASMQALGARLAQAVDVGRSGVVVGVEHTVVGGTGPTLVAFALHRSPAMDHDQFSAYWLGNHGQLAHANPRPGPGGYRQLHADPERTGEAARIAGFGVSDYDGLVSADFRDVDDMRSVFAEPSVSQVALADERRFIDHATSAIALMRLL